MSHIGYMNKRRSSPNRIAELRKAKNWTQQQLADAIGAHWITVSKLERGVMRLSDEWRLAIANALGVDEWAVAAESRLLPVAHVEGFIEEGGRIVPLEDDDVGESFQISTHFFTHPLYRWLVVAGDALWPWYQDGDRLCLWHIDESEIESVRGRVCLLWYEDKSGTSEVTMGVLEGRARDGRYTINRFGMPPIRDAKLTSVAAVAMAIYYLGPESMEESSDISRDTGPVS